MISYPNTYFHSAKNFVKQHNPKRNHTSSPKNSSDHDIAEQVRTRLKPWLKYDYTVWPKLEKKVSSFNNIIFKNLIETFNRCTVVTPTAESIHALGHHFLIESGESYNRQEKNNFDVSQKNFHNVYKINLSSLLQQIQQNGILWKPITKRFRFIKAELNKQLDTEKKRTQWTNTLSMLLGSLISLPKNMGGNERKKTNDHKISPLLLLIDNLDKGIKNSKIQKIVNHAAADEQELSNVITALRKWSEIQHVWNQALYPDAPIDDIDYVQVLRSFSAGDSFLPEKIIIQDQPIDVVGSLFSDPEFRDAIRSRLEKTKDKTPECPEHEILQNLASSLINGTLPVVPSSAIPKFLIDWCKIFDEEKVKNNNQTFSDQKFEQLMNLASISKEDLFSVDRRQKINRTVRNMFSLIHGNVEEQVVLDEIKAQNIFIKNLHDFLRVYCPRILNSKLFDKFVFTHLCRQIYQAGFDPSVKNVPEIVTKLLKREDDSNQLKRLWTLLRFCSVGCFAKATAFSKIIAPGLYRGPYFTKTRATHLYIKFQEQAFTVIQERPHYFYQRKILDDPNKTEMDESKCYAEILFSWMITDTGKITQEKPEEKCRTAILEFPHVKFNADTPREIREYVLRSIIGSDDSKNSDKSNTISSQSVQEEK